MTLPPDEFTERAKRIRRHVAASIAACALHLQCPELAREAGSRGGATRGAQLRGNATHMRWVARKKYYGLLAGPMPPPPMGDSP